MAPLNLFIPLTKVDEENRIVYGVATAESLDRSGEVCDYASTKPYYERWSNGIAKSTGGRSLGNVRAMHGKVAAGKLIDISFDDAAKKIAVAAKVVDDGEWSKVLEGVYTGFSHGGRYVRKWTENGTKRYTADPSELSLVDLPCLPEATFEVVKADGATETRGFLAKTFSEEQLAPLAWELAKEAGVTEWEAALELAKNHLAAEQVRKAEIDVGDVEKWEESKHPRGEGGKFSAGGAAVGAAVGAAAGGLVGGKVGAAVGTVIGASVGSAAGGAPRGKDGGNGAPKVKRHGSQEHHSALAREHSAAAVREGHRGTVAEHHTIAAEAHRKAAKSGSKEDSDAAYGATDSANGFYGQKRYVGIAQPKRAEKAAGDDDDIGEDVDVDEATKQEFLDYLNERLPALLDDVRGQLKAGISKQSSLFDDDDGAETAVLDAIDEVFDQAREPAEKFAKADWEESKHPRAGDGKFTSGSGGGSAGAKEPRDSLADGAKSTASHLATGIALNGVGNFLSRVSVTHGGKIGLIANLGIKGLSAAAKFAATGSVVSALGEGVGSVAQEFGADKKATKATVEVLANVGLAAYGFMQWKKSMDSAYEAVKSKYRRQPAPESHRLNHPKTIDLKAEKWSESEHPRDDEGQWTEAAGAIATEAAAGAVSGIATGAIAGGVSGGPAGAAIGALSGGALGALGGAISEGVKQYSKPKEPPKPKEDSEEEEKGKGKKKVAEKWVEPAHKQFWSCGCDGHDHEHVTKAEAVSCMKDRLAKAEAAELPEVVAAREALELSKQAMKQLEKKPEEEPDGDEAANENPEGEDEKPEGEEAPHAEPDGDEAPAEAAKKAISKAVDDLISRDADPIDVMTKMLAKYGARNSSKDLSVIQAIHDHAAHLGAQCSESEGGAAEKVDAGDLAKLAANNEELRSSLTSVTSQLQELSKKVEVLSRSPAPAKAAVFAVSKAADGQAASETPEEALLKRMNSMSPEQRQHELMKLALRIPVAPIQ